MSIPPPDLRFLTPEVAEAATMSVINFIVNPQHQPLVKITSGHVIIFVPSSPPARSSDAPFHAWPRYLVEPAVLYRTDVLIHDGQLVQAAEDVALRHWHERENGSAFYPHLIYEGESLFAGGIRHAGIVVGVAGFPHHFAVMVAHMIAAACVALAAEGYILSMKRTRA